MKSEELLRAIGDIDDQLIESAEVKKDNAKLPGKEKTQGKPALSRRGRAFRWAGGIAAALAVCVGIGAAFGGIRMGASAPKEADNYSDGAYYYASDQAAAAEQAFNSADLSGTASAEEHSSAQGLPLNPAERAKLIYTAHMSLQTTDFDESLQSLTKLVSDNGGYFESSQVYNGSYYSENYNKTGSYTVRVPSSKYRSFLESVGAGMHVVNMSEDVKDVGTRYFELEQRLETLRIKEDRLQKLLAEADNMSDIIELENALSNTEYDIDCYSSDLNRYDSLIDYSTVYVELTQVSQLGGNVTNREGFGARFARAVSNGFTNFGEGLEDLAVWIGYNLITLVILAAIVIFIIKFHLFARLREKFRK